MKNFRVLLFIVVATIFSVSAISAQTMVIKSGNGYTLNNVSLSTTDLAAIQRLLPTESYLFASSGTGKNYGTLSMDKAIQMTKTSIAQANLAGAARFSTCYKISASSSCLEYNTHITKANLASDVSSKLDQILLKYNK